MYNFKLREDSFEALVASSHLHYEHLGPLLRDPRRARHVDVDEAALDCVLAAADGVGGAALVVALVPVPEPRDDQHRLVAPHLAPRLAVVHPAVARRGVAGRGAAQLESAAELLRHVVCGGHRADHGRVCGEKEISRDSNEGYPKVRNHGGGPY